MVVTVARLHVLTVTKANKDSESLLEILLTDSDRDPALPYVQDLENKFKTNPESLIAAGLPPIVAIRITANGPNALQSGLGTVNLPLTIGLAIGITAGIFIIVFVIIICVRQYRQKRKDPYQKYVRLKKVGIDDL